MTYVVFHSFQNMSLYICCDVCDFMISVAQDMIDGCNWKVHNNWDHCVHMKCSGFNQMNMSASLLPFLMWSIIVPFFQCISPHYSHFKIQYFATKTFLCKVSLCSIYLHAIAQYQYAVLFKIFHHIPRTRIFNMLQQSTCATFSLAFLEAWKCLFFFFKK